MSKIQVSHTILDNEQFQKTDKMKGIFLLITVVVFQLEVASAQQTSFTLPQVIEIAQEGSFDAFRAKNMYRLQEVNYKEFLNELKPRANLNVTPLNYTRSIQETYNSTLKRYEPVEIQQLTSQYNMGVTKKVGITGGSLSLNSGLTRSQRYSDNNTNLDFFSTPLRLTYRHNFAQVNSWKWKARTAPLRFKQAKLEFLERQEEIAGKAVNFFFSLLNAQVNLEIAQLNKTNADTLLSMGHKREAIGSITRDNMYNLQLRQINAVISLNQAKNTLENTRLNLCDFLEIPLDSDVICIPPKEVNLEYIDPTLARQLANTNNPNKQALLSKLIDAQQRVKSARLARYGVNLEAGIGFNQNKDNFTDAFQDLLNRQNFRINLSIPLLDWGDAKRRIQRAKLNEKLVVKDKRKREQSLLLEVAQKANEFNLKRSELNSAAIADTISQYAYTATQQRFLLGKVNVISINDSYKAMYTAKNRYVSVLRSYWQYYFTMRKLCLYDFERQFELMNGFENLLQKKN